MAVTRFEGNQAMAIDPTLPLDDPEISELMIQLT